MIYYCTRIRIIISFVSRTGSTNCSVHVCALVAVRAAVRAAEWRLPARAVYPAQDPVLHGLDQGAAASNAHLVICVFVYTRFCTCTGVRIFVLRTHMSQYEGGHYSLVIINKNSSAQILLHASYRPNPTPDVAHSDKLIMYSSRLNAADNTRITLSDFNDIDYIAKLLQLRNV